MKARLSLLCTAWLLLSLCLGFSSNAIHLDPICIGKLNGFSPAAASDVFVLGNYAYVADSSGLHIIDIRNPAQPVRVGNVSIDGASSVFVHPPYAFVTGYSGFDVVDISNPAAPTHLGNFFNGAAYRGSVVLGQYAYALGAGVQQIDISDPAHPFGFSAYQEYKQPSRIAVVGPYLYVADDSSSGVMAILDPTNVQHAVKVLHNGYIVGMVVRGNLLYMQNLGVGLAVYDVTDPLTPVLQRVEPEVGIGDFASAGDYVVTPGIAVYQSQSAPPSYRLCGQYIVPGERASSFAVNNHYLYALMTTPTGGEFRIIDLFAPSALQPTPLAFGSAARIALAGDSLYKLDSAGLKIFDVSSADNPRLISETPIPGDTMAVAENRVCIASKTNIAVLDISNPANPTPFLDVDSDLSFKSDIKISGGRLYVMGLLPGSFMWSVAIYDISGGQSAGYQGRLFFNQPGSIAVDGARAIVVDGDFGLTAIDVSDPTAPKSLGSIANSNAEKPFAVAISGNYAYAVTGTSVYDVSRAHFVTVDISDLSHPAVVASIPLSRSPAGIRYYTSDALQIVGTNAFVGGIGIEVVNIADPLHPVLVDRNYAFTTTALAANENHLFANTSGGAVGLQNYPPRAPWVRIHAVPPKTSEAPGLVIHAQAQIAGRIQRAESLGVWTDLAPATAQRDAATIVDNSSQAGSIFYRFISP